LPNSVFRHGHAVRAGVRAYAWWADFRAEFFNIFNQANFGSPQQHLTDPLFGHSTETLASSLGSGGANALFNPLYQIGGPCSIQLAVKLAF
jgi:hypothetical protein